MPVNTILEKSNGVVVGAELTCSLREENKAHRESYSADWHSVSLKTQPQDRQTMNMNDDSRRETLSPAVASPFSETNLPLWCLQSGHCGKRGEGAPTTAKEKNPPLANLHPPQSWVSGLDVEPHTPREDLHTFPTPDGVCPSKRTVDEITRDLPPVKPTLMEFFKAPRDLRRSMSQEAQRG